MAKQSDLERVRSAIEALNAGTIAYSEFDAVVASAVAAGSMTREDVRHELEAALMAENVRREPPVSSTADVRVPPELVRPVRPSRPLPKQSRRAGRPWLGRLLAGIVVFALIGAFAGFMIPRLQLGGSGSGNAPSPLAQSGPPGPPVPPLQKEVPEAPLPPDPTPPETAAVEAPNEDVPVPPRVSTTPPVSSPNTAPHSALPEAAAAPAAMPVAIRQEDPDSPPANSQNSPHLHVAQGYETFADRCPYPRKALTHGETGKVGLLAYVATDGHVVNTAIVNSSGSEDLDVAAAACLKEQGHFAPKFAAGHALGYWGRMTFNWSFGE